jgi:hypothetical protein
MTAIGAGLWALAGLALAAPAWAAPGGPADELAGRYSRHFANGLVSGEKYASDDIAEVVPVGNGAAYVRVSLQFYNGHSCDISGVAEAAGGKLVYHEAAPMVPGETPCTLSLSHIGDALAIDDGDGSCSAYCGARGSLSGQTLPWTSRRTITYLARLKASTEYKDALAAREKQPTR